MKFGSSWVVRCFMSRRGSDCLAAMATFSAAVSPGPLSPDRTARCAASAAARAAGTSPGSPPMASAPRNDAFVRVHTSLLSFQVYCN